MALAAGHGGGMFFLGAVGRMRGMSDDQRALAGPSGGLFSSV